MKQFYFIILFSFFTIGLSAQNPRYLIELTDKNLTANPYSIEEPEELLSAKAIERRENQDIQIDTLDIPISPEYIDSLLSYQIKIQNRSRWMNSIVAEIETSLVDSLKKISFVKNISFLAPPRNIKKDTTVNKGLQSNTKTYEKIKTPINDTSTYGYSANQIMMLNGHLLHLNGFEGQNKTIAVLDGGFRDADKLPAFDSLWANNQILGTKDFEDNDGDVFKDHAHGTYVLSILAGNIPGFLYGSAPKANYWLMRTEVTSSEYLIEEYNWIAAAEFADSAGVDIINTSLGYSDFDDSSQSHTYKDMNGDTAPVSIGADIAASKGILVVVSAGNLGNSQWHYISAPADADSVLSVGAVDQFGDYASFSSTGPSADGRVKPDLAAQGQGTAFQYTDSSVVSGNGTSFSAPVISGLAACLWQNSPQSKNMEIIERLKQNAHQYNNPDSLLGYGLPDFGKASGLDYPSNLDNYFAKKIPEVFPNPFQDSFNLIIPGEVKTNQPIRIDIYNIVGTQVYSREFPSSVKGSPVTISEIRDESPGFYFIKILYDKNSVIRKKIIKSE